MIIHVHKSEIARKTAFFYTQKNCAKMHCSTVRLNENARAKNGNATSTVYLNELQKHLCSRFTSEPLKGFR